MKGNPDGLPYKGDSVFRVMTPAYRALTSLQWHPCAETETITLRNSKRCLPAAVSFLLALSLPAWAQIPSLPYEQPTSGTITSAGQTNNYTLSANLNDVLNFTVVTTSSTSGTLGPCISLYAPGSSTPVDTAGGGYSQDVEMNGYAVKASGTYTVTIQDCAAVATGDYVIFVYKTNNPVPVFALPYAQVTTGQISSVTQANAYSLSANENDVLSFTVVTTSSTSGTLGPCIWLYNSAGTPLLDSAGGGYSTDVEMNGYKVPATGTYNVFIKDCADTATGDYVIFVQKMNDPIDSSPIVYDELQTGSIVSATQSNAYTLKGTMGDVLNFTVDGTTVPANGATFGPCILLYNTAKAQPLDSAGGGYNQSVEMNGYTIPATGTYNVFIKDCADVATGTYTLHTDCVSGTCALPVPSIASLSPTSVLAGSGPVTLTVNGSGFASVLSKSEVQWNGSGSGINTTFSSVNLLTAAIPGTDTAVAGVYPVTVFTPPGGTSGGTSTSVNFTVENPAPTVTSMAPNSFVIGSACPLTLTIDGTGYNTQTVVYWNGVALVSMLVSSTEITAEIPCSDLMVAGTDQVNIENPTVGSPAQGGGSVTKAFTVDNPVPTLTSISPTTVTAGSGATTLTVTGTGFVNTSAVQWNGNGLPTNFVSPTELTATISSADLGCGSSVSITVFNPGPGGGPSSAKILTVKNPAPSITSVSPQNGPAGEGPLTLTVKGAGFVNCTSYTVVQWTTASTTAAPLTTTFVSPTELTVIVPASDTGVPVTGYVTAYNPPPGGGTTSPKAHPVTIGPYPVPTTGPISPITGIAGGPGFTLTVTGTNFVPGSVVDWNTTALATTFKSATQLTAAVPAADIGLGTAGTVPITVKNPTPGGGTSNVQTFTISNPVPVCSSLSPASTPAQGSAFTLTVTGSNFAPNATVQWNGSGLSTPPATPTQVSAMVPASDITAQGTATITVFNPTPGGGPCSPALPFTIDPPLAAAPTISPSAGSYGSGQIITVTDATLGATLYFTTNGAAPTAASTLYKGPFLLSTSATVQAVAIATGYTNSDTASSAFIIGGSPVALSLPAFGITASAADLRALVSDQNLAGQVWFVYGTSPTALSTSTPTQDLAASKTAQTVKVALTGLTAKTTYYFQAVVTTAGGMSTSAVLSFSTP